MSNEQSFTKWEGCANLVAGVAKGSPTQWWGTLHEQENANLPKSRLERGKVKLTDPKVLSPADYTRLELLVIFDHLFSRASLDPWLVMDSPLPIVIP